jgi:hypothetical protein
MKVRVDKMGEIWSALHEWAWLNDQWMSKIGEAKAVESGLKEPEEFAFTPDELKEQATTGNQKAQKLRQNIEFMLEKERFWLSEALYREYRTYFDTERRRTYLFFQVFLTDDSDQAKLDEIQAEAEKINKATEEARMDVLKVTENLTLQNP